MAPNLPQIRVSDIEILGDWDFENVKAIGDSIPGYRSSASQLMRAFLYLYHVDQSVHALWMSI